MWTVNSTQYSVFSIQWTVDSNQYSVAVESWQPVSSSEMPVGIWYLELLMVSKQFSVTASSIE